MNFTTKVRLLVLACSLLFLASAAGLLWMVRYHHEALHSSDYYQNYLRMRAIALRPTAVVPFAVLIVYGIVWALRKKERPLGDIERLAVLALAICTAFGMILLSLIPL